MTCAECERDRSPLAFPPPTRRGPTVCHECRKELRDELRYLHRRLGSWSKVQDLVGISQTSRVGYMQRRVWAAHNRDVIASAYRAERKLERAERDVRRQLPTRRPRRRCERCVSYLKHDESRLCRGCIRALAEERARP